MEGGPISTYGEAPESHSFAATVERRQRRLRFYRVFVSGVIALNVVLFIVMSWLVLTSRSQMNSSFVKTVQTTQAAKELQYQDQIASLLGRLVAFSGDRALQTKFEAARTARKAALDTLTSLDSGLAALMTSTLGSGSTTTPAQAYTIQNGFDETSRAFATTCIDGTKLENCAQALVQYYTSLPQACYTPSGGTLTCVNKYQAASAYTDARSILETATNAMLSSLGGEQSDQTSKVSALSSSSIVVVAVALGYVVVSSIATLKIEFEKDRQLKAMTHQMDKDMAREYKLMMEDMRGAFYERLKVFENEYKMEIKRHQYYPQASETFGRLRETVVGQLTQVKRLSAQLKDAQINEAAENLNGIANQLKEHQTRVLHTTDESRDTLLVKWKQFQEQHRNKEMSKLAGILQQILTNSHVRRGVFFLRCAVFEDSPHRAVLRLLTSWEHNVVSAAFSQWLLEAHCEENLQFLRSVGDYENAPREERPARSFDIYTKFVGSECDAEVNLDSSSKLLLDIFFDEKAAARQEKKGPLRLGPNDRILTMDDVDNGTVFSQAKACILHLLATDSYPRFLQSKHGQELRQDLLVVEALLPEMLAPLHRFNSESEELVTQYALRAVRAGQFEVAQQCWSEGTRLFAFSSSQSVMSKMLIPLAGGSGTSTPVTTAASVPSMPPAPMSLPPPSATPSASANAGSVASVPPAGVTSLNSPPPISLKSGPGPSSRVPEDKRSPPSETKVIEESRPPSSGGERRGSVEARPTTANGTAASSVAAQIIVPPSPSAAAGSLVMLDVNSTIGLPPGTSVNMAATTSLASEETIIREQQQRARPPSQGEDRLLNFHLAAELGFLTQCQADWLAVRNLELADLNAAEQKIAALLQRMESEKERWIRFTVDEVYSWQPEMDSTAQTIYESPLVVPHLVRVECIRRLEELIGAARGAQQDMERRLQMNQPWIVPTVLPGSPAPAPNATVAGSGVVHFHDDGQNSEPLPQPPSSPPGGASASTANLAPVDTAITIGEPVSTPIVMVDPPAQVVVNLAPPAGHMSPVPEESPAAARNTSLGLPPTSPGGANGDLLSARGATAPPPHPLGAHHLASDPLLSPTSPHAIAVSAARLRQAESRTGLNHISPPLSPHHQSSTGTTASASIVPATATIAAPVPATRSQSRNNSRPGSSAKNAVAALIAGTATANAPLDVPPDSPSPPAPDESSTDINELPLSSTPAVAAGSTSARGSARGDRPLSAGKSASSMPLNLSAAVAATTATTNNGSNSGRGGNNSARGHSPKSPPRGHESLTMHLSHHATEEDLPSAGVDQHTAMPGVVNADESTGGDSKLPST